MNVGSNMTDNNNNGIGTHTDQQHRKSYSHTQSKIFYKYDCVLCSLFICIYKAEVKE